MKFCKFFMLLAFLTIFSLSCGVTPEEYEGEPNICAILTTDSFAQVMVGRTAAINDTVRVKIIIDTSWDIEDEDTIYYVDTITVPLWNGVSGAEVSLKHGEESFSLTEDSTGYYYADSIAFAAEQTWELEVTYPSGEETSAQTTIPGSFEITSPLVDTLAETDTLIWTPSIGATGYSIRARIWLSWEDEEEDTLVVDSFLMSLMLVQADTTSLPMQELELFDYRWVDSDSLILFVSALDTNAYDYRYPGFYWWENLRIEDYMHIPGAWGVFGSQTVISRKYFLENYEFPLP